MAQLHRFSGVFPPHQNRHQFVVARYQGRIRIDIEYLDCKRAFVAQALQGDEHVVAQVAVAARIQREMDHLTGRLAAPV